MHISIGLNELTDCIYVSLNWVVIGLGNGMLPVWYQAITWTNDDLFSLWP